MDREYFVVLMLDTKNRVIGLNTVHIGTINSSLVSTRETFKPALLANATAVILAHNHPSGDPTPSPEDVAVTRKLVEAGQLLDIEVLDHIIIGDEGRSVSLKDRGLGF
jgi:DNA repair protein RadC